MEHRHPSVILKELRHWTSEIDALEKKGDKLPQEGELTDEHKAVAAQLQQAVEKLRALATEWQQAFTARILRGR